MRRAWLVVGGAVVGLVSLQWSSCGGGGDAGATFRGNVRNVNRAQSNAAAPRPALPALGDWLVGRAVAQSPCPASGVLVCTEIVPKEGDSRFTCAPVDPDSCKFGLRIALRFDEQPKVFFDDDRDRNKTFEPGDSADIRADLANSPSPVCNGDVFEISNVDIDFPNRSATAETIERKHSGCPITPSPTPTGGAATPTPTARGEATATPTAGGEATATPTAAETPTPSEGTPTETPTPGGAEPTPTPSCGAPGDPCSLNTDCCSQLCPQATCV